MRELKFRAWCPKRSRFETIPLWEKGNLSEEDDFSVWMDDLAIEQYTGLKDKNGKEIYEGDIVRTTDRVTVKHLIFLIGVVEFKQQAFWICNVPSERPDFTHNETLLKYWETDLEVIGNIHENPELLGGEE